jgi:urea ABC transporter urea binding protein
VPAHGYAVDPDTIKVGVLHSLSGTMAISETTLKDTMLMLVEEQNEKGGLLGKKLEAVVVDPASDWPLFAEKARELLEKDKVAAVFGCWTSVSRKSVLPVFEELNGILFYPVQYEGEESSRNVFYTGAAPNQQAIPAVDYLKDELGVERWVLAGTDYVYPRTTNKILEAYLKQNGVAEEDIMINYTPFGHSDWQSIVADIKKFGSEGKKTAVVSTINGDANVPFYKELGNQGISAEDIPVVAFSVGEEELSGIDTKPLVGHLAAWNYFMSVDTRRTRPSSRPGTLHQGRGARHQRSDGGAQDRLRSLGEGGREGRHHGPGQGHRRHRRALETEPHRRHGQDAAQPPHHQAGADRRDPGRRSVRRGLGDRGRVPGDAWSDYLSGTAVARLGAAARRHRAGHHLRRDGRHQHGPWRDGDARRLHDLRGAGGHPQSAPGLFDYSLLIALPLAFLVAGAVGIAIERGIIRFLYGRPLETLLATWGVSLILQQAVRTIFGPTNREVGNPSWMSGAFEIGRLTITYNRIWIIVFALVVFAGLLLTLKRTRSACRCAR